MITISACLIVKNEEAVLERGLKSLQGIYDELIIVDTGSTDRTKEIAANYTDKIYDYVWQDDFAAARNYLFSKAGMEYIYVADADEVLQPEEREKFLKLKQVLLPEIEIVQMQYANQLAYNTTYNYDVEYRPKLYKRLRSFVWKDAVHESVSLEPVIYDSDIVVSHCPMEAHGARDFRIFQKVIQREGNLSKKLRMMYARELFIAGQENDFLEAYPYFQKRMEEASMKEELCQIYPVLMHCARVQKDCMAMLTYSTKALAGEAAGSECCYELGEFYYQAGLYQEATIWFYNAAFECESELYLKYQREYPLQRLADCYEKLGMEQEVRHYKELMENLE